jgi:diguanylate cyclase (GGDEF)-like protein
MIEASDIDLVLLDIQMDNMDGFAVLEEIRKNYSANEMPVIMVTANSESEHVVRAFESGANDYIHKPIDPAVTMARIDMQIQFMESRKALKKSEERYSLVAQGTNDGLWDWDIATDEVFYSTRWLTMLEVGEKENTRTPDVWLSRIHAEDRDRVIAELENHKAGLTPHFETEMRMRHQNGSFRWTLCRGLAVRNKQNQAVRMAGSLTDITEGKVADALTGLPNRVLFGERLNRCFERSARDNSFKFSLFYLDLDNFKLVNDSLGHDAGDRLLVSIARRLESSLRKSDSFLCRLGGDEFAILIEGIESNDEPVEVAKRIISGTSAPISLGGGREVFASVSVGISNSTDNHTDSKEMLQAADTAMYRAKAQGKSCYRVFDPVMKEESTNRLDIENELRHAVERKDLFVHYQPIVDLRTTRVVGFEALVRWSHERIGMISPAKFIPIAEETGLIAEISQQVLLESCRQMAEWKAADPRFEPLQVSVNLSNRQLCNNDVVKEVIDVLKLTGLKPGDLRLEVTESTIMKNPEQGAKTLSMLREQGVKVAIDDFGTGYSSLAYIHELSPDVVKIDRSFINQITMSADKETIVTAIIALADGLSLDVVAEGVETEVQRALLASMGCGYAQGFMFSRPLAADQVLDFVTDNFTGLDADTVATK